jgi:hypothetical protein
MLTLRIFAASAAFATSACAAFSGSILLSVPTDVSEPRGYSVGRPVAIKTAQGTRFHGSVCRQTTAPPPGRIQIDRVSSTGRLTASATHSLSGLGGRNSSCTYYDVETDWVISSGERVRVCALRGETPCPEPK